LAFVRPGATGCPLRPKALPELCAAPGADGDTAACEALCDDADALGRAGDELAFGPVVRAPVLGCGEPLPEPDRDPGMLDVGCGAGVVGGVDTVPESPDRDGCGCAGRTGGGLCDGRGCGWLRTGSMWNGVSVLTTLDTSRCA
jgi:hypothetical protein